MSVLLTHVTMKEPILDKENIFAGDTFTVTCDMKRFDGVPATVNLFTLMAVGRKTKSDDDFHYLANYTPYNTENIYSESLPSGRDMFVNQTGERLVQNQLNRHSISISLTVRSSLCIDAGQYQCLTTGVDTANARFSSEATLTCKEPIVNKNNFVPGEVIVVTCDADRFENIPSRKSILFNMTIKRKTKSYDTFQILASHLTRDETEEHVNNIPRRRKWDISTTGATLVNGLQDRRKLKVSLTLYDTCCTDAGQYMCLALLDNKIYLSQPYSVACNEPVVMGNLVQTPSTRSGDNVVYTCTYSGSTDLRAIWKIAIHGVMAEIKYPYDNHTHTTGPMMGNNCLGCEVAMFISKLDFTISDNENATTYICVVYDSAVERSRANVMLYVNCSAGL
ncbi:hypothetical protein Btru_067283 [Bulinus truncatus]|nr:hypothetical protein Btru_067283 [Bulinus truncatus]